MTRDETPDDYVTEALPEGEWAYSCDDDELEEEDESDSSSSYASLLTLGAGARKKQPLIIVDPVEAENEVRRIQYVAVQQLVDPDEVESVDRRENSGHPADPVAPPTDNAVPDLSHAHRVAGDEVAAGAGEECEDVIGDSGEQIAELVAFAELFGPFAESPAPEMPGLAESKATKADVVEPEPADWNPPVSPPPVVVPSGHNLRARMPAQPSSRTFADRLQAILDRILGWLR